ncbi:MAG: hypothetical protein A2Y03_06500 [Omnitrophica WOR_2 bacterium GWF2_38_59]|nr:MAG: hypothetical protein A2Y03_06500 [Omnitrophica WOR_2 bacterium GWF2_38_59]OGX50499.1 MAG: hypothetical protein A2243_02075 [Omnitrophica WOR_2 bacterium RIFOXYA2_FULL_38_17]OGX54490.1 MAG: hypothetical protein A2267_06650 [Omnitrophica WOR_2 bacterium RIFOXYA12_FULL_38_10]OGX59508.1 MAG: hypothetical protein A2306_09700 [Omnitrophica WOR_2 bacterium RIFOXYB2_FULL_38_16]HBG62025.1 hypothetical protein [Candidatus Omnitrophota bacterium]
MDVEQREAKYGEKMIEIKVRFWTDQIAKDKGNIKPKHCWDAGVVRVKTNNVHDIKPKQPILFRSLMDIPRAIEDCLIENGITAHTENCSSKYIYVDEL